MGRYKTRDEPADGGAAVSFASRLRSLREAAGLTQEELASRAGLSPHAVSALERGARRRPHPHTARSLAEALGLSEGERALLLASVPKRSGAAPSAEELSPASALPHPATPLVGRERQLEEVRGLLAGPDARLLTLTGIGGVGKTRLAVEAAREVAEDFPDGAAFVGLAPLATPSLVVPTVLRTLGVPEAQGRTPSEALIEHLRDKALLLVLDNLEHLLEAAPEVAALIEACPGLTVLATSRAPLRVRGEREYPVGPLSLPPTTRNPTENEVLAAPSGRLFLERARAVSPGFAITEENATDVARICWRLAGIPLALELAAAKVRFLDPTTLLPRLDRALSGAWARDLPERQRTMRAALDWSHGLLTEGERALFRRLSVFAGGFTLEAVEIVGAEVETTGRSVAEDPLSLLGRLVEQSLVMMEPGADRGEVRYGMLEPVRQYALEKLEESGEADEVRRAHAALFLALAERARPELRRARQLDWLGRLERENGNLRAAMSWALAADDAETAARLGWALWVFWWLRGQLTEGRRWMKAVLDMKGQLPLALRARAIMSAEAMAYGQADHATMQGYAEELMGLSRQMGGDAQAEAYARLGFALVAMGRSEYEAATEHLKEAFPLFLESGEEGLASTTLTFLGRVALLQGDHAGATRRFEEGLALARSTGDRLSLSNALFNISQAARARGDYDLAARLLQEGVSLSSEMRHRANLAHFLEALAAVVAAQGQAERSARLFGTAEALLQTVGASIHGHYTPDRSSYESTVTAVRCELGDVAFEAAWAEGRAMGLDEAVEEALAGDEAQPAGPRG